MSQTLLEMGLASIQGYLAAARRSRDLWSGSQILSELAKALAMSLHKQGATLLFPAPENPDADLLPDSTLHVSNKVVAVLPVAPNGAASIVEGATRAVQGRWLQIARPVAAETRRLAPPGSRHHVFRARVWRAQIREPIELYAAWLGVDHRDLKDAEQYRETMAELERLMIRRKLTRCFPASPLPVDLARGLEKSSLDGRRESVVAPAATPATRRRWGLNDREALDAIGLIKRLGKRPGPFLPLSRIAADPWLRGLDTGQLATIESCFEAHKKLLIEAGLLSKVAGLDRFPFDAELLYDFRLDAQANLLRQEPERDQDLIALVERGGTLHRTLAPIWDSAGKPDPFVAVLMGDGDGIGAIIREKLKSVDEYQRFSQALARFAMSIRDEILPAHHGQGIYAGGDELLALLPLDQWMTCADAIHASFGEATRDVLRFEAGLSLGIAIGHMTEPMGAMLDRARAALALAKGGSHEEISERNRFEKNALCVRLKPPGGGELVWRGTFSDGTGTQPVRAWVDDFANQRLARTAPYRVRQCLRRLDGLRDDRDGIPDYHQGLFIKLLAKMVGDETEDSELAVRMVERANEGQQGAKGLVNELLIARFLAARLAEGDRP